MQILESLSTQNPLVWVSGKDMSQAQTYTNQVIAPDPMNWKKLACN